jgi:Na+/melibiose symporter-like transporter
VLISSRHVPESVDPKAGHTDVTGAAAITAALVGLTYGLIEGPANGWSAVVIGGLIASAVLFVAFVYVESRKRSPLVPLSIFLSRQFSAANAATFLVYAALAGVLFLLPIVLQVVLGYSPLLAGTALLPVTVIMLLLSARSAALAARIGPRLQMTVGPLVIAAGLALLTRVGPGSTYLNSVLPAMVVFGLGLAINVAPLTATVLAAAPAEHAGIASAVNNDVARTGGLIAVAILPAAAGITGSTFANQGGLAHGFHKAALIAAAGCVIAGVLGFATIRNPIVEQQAEKHPHDCERSCALDGPPLRGAHHHSSERISSAARSPDRTAPSI